MIEHRGTIRNLAKWCRLCVRVVDRSPRMERNTDNSATVAAGLTSTGVLTRGQMARALREGVVGEARPGGTDGGAISRVGVRKYINNIDLRISGGCVTLAMLMAATITVAPTAGIPRNSANPTSSAPKVAGSIPRTPGPSVGDGNSVHPYVSDVNQGHQKKMLNKITSVTAAAVVGIAATVAGAQSTAVQWKVEDGGNGHWYQFVRNLSIDWKTASTRATSMAGHLATITGSEENAFIFGYLSSVSAWGAYGRGPFLGGFQDRSAADYAETAGGWRWVNGESWSSSNWATYGFGEPNDDSGGSGPEDFLAMDNRAPGNCMWNDVALNGFAGGSTVPEARTAVGYLVEWSADCNNDGTVDYGQILRGELPDTNQNSIPDTCECIGDIDLDGAIGGSDLGIMLAYWGVVTTDSVSLASDLNADGFVDGSDLGVLLAHWGACQG